MYSFFLFLLLLLEPQKFSGKGICAFDKEQQENKCIGEDGEEILKPAGCKCSTDSQCESNLCYGSAMSKKLFGDGVCQYTARKIANKCSDIDTCDDCSISNYRSLTGTNRCVWSAHKVDHRPEKWGETEEEQIATRKEAGCHAAGGDHTWEANRWVDHQHQDKCEMANKYSAIKKEDMEGGKIKEAVADGGISTRIEAVKECSTIKKCSECVHTAKKKNRGFFRHSGECGTFCVGCIVGTATVRIRETQPFSFFHSFFGCSLVDG